MRPSTEAPPRRRWRSRLVYRLYALGVAQLLLTLAVALAVGSALAKNDEHWSTRDLASVLAPTVDTPGDTGRALATLGASRSLALAVYELGAGAGRLLASNVDPALPAPRWLLGADAELPRAGLRPGSDLRAPPPDDRPPGAPPPRFIPPGVDDLRGPRDLPGLAPPPGRPPREALDLPPPGPGAPPPPDEYVPFERNGRSFLVVIHFTPRPFRNAPLLALALGLVVVGAGALVGVRWIVRPLERLTRAARALGAGDLRARSELRRGDEVGELAAAFDEMAERIQVLLAAERELLANVSHELRTPLARIRVALDLASEGDAEAARASVAEIGVDLAELERLVDDVLQATRFAAAEGKGASAAFPMHVEEASPASVAKVAVERFRIHHPKRPVTLRIEDGLPRLRLDPQLVRRVLANVLENAHKYTPDEARPIDLVVERLEPPGSEGPRAATAEGVRFEVVDRGIGVPLADRGRVFEPFFRGERSRARGTGGVGLGLTLARRIVRAHGGEMTLAEGEDGGTRVVVTLRNVPAREGSRGEVMIPS